MQLKPTQIVGLVAVVVFGAIFVATLVQPKRDLSRHPAAVQTRGVSSPAVEAIPPSSPGASVSSVASLSPIAGPTVPANPALAGSAEAKDDLYCQGLIYAAHRAAPNPADPADRRRLLMAPALASAGAGKLIKEGVATRETTAIFADAHTDSAMADFAAGKPRIALAACEARAEAALKALRQ